MTPLRTNKLLSSWSIVVHPFKSFKILLIRLEKATMCRVPTREDSTPKTPIQPPESAVPESSSALAAPVVDLTDQIKIMNSHPVAHGGFADIHRGEWVQTAGETQRAAVKPIQVRRTFFFPLLRPNLISYRSLSNFSACLHDRMLLLGA